MDTWMGKMGIVSLWDRLNNIIKTKELKKKSFVWRKRNENEGSLDIPWTASEVIVSVTYFIS